MVMKRCSRNEQVRAVYEADQSSLDLAAEQIKSVLRGISNAAPRRQRISSAWLMRAADFDIGFIHKSTLDPWIAR